jgi:hypothetical protein
VNRKIPPEALSVYLSMGPGRSYEAVARHYGASKRAVVDRAKKEDWQGRVAQAEQRAREKAEVQAGQSLEEMNERHLKTAQLIQRKALEALGRLSLDEAMDAVRALKIGLDHERLIQGEPSERSAVEIRETIRLEYERWMRPEEELEPRVIEAVVEDGAEAAGEGGDDQDGP